MNDVDVKMNDTAMDELQKKGRLYLETLAENVRVEAQDLCPVKTGFLRDSIGVFEGENEDEKYIGSKTTTYALFVELGHMSVKGNDVPPQPFLRMAIETIFRNTSRFKG